MNPQTESRHEPRPRPDHSADQIEQWLALHRLGAFVGPQRELYESHAMHLLKLLTDMHRSIDRVSEEMEHYAREVESIGHYRPTYRDSFQSAADAIRTIARQQYEPPWADVAVDLENRPQLSRLAHVLWDHNRRRDSEWTVPFNNVLDRVWTNPEPSPGSQIIPAASRLSNWMHDRSVPFTVSVDNRGRRFLCQTA